MTRGKRRGEITSLVSLRIFSVDVNYQEVVYTKIDAYFVI